MPMVAPSAGGSGAAPERGAAYQGLPAKFELPNGARVSSFSEQLLSPARPQRITLVLLSMTIVTWTSIALALIAAWLVWGERAALRAALTARFAAAVPPPEATA
jgi:hypothetical protein